MQAPPATTKPKRHTVAQLEATIAELRTVLDNSRDAAATDRRLMNEARAAEKETRAQFSDLKERLAIAEANNQQMRGYIARVQEDDVVREDLVTIGDPEGHQQMVPKRKPHRFDQPSPYTQLGAECDVAMSIERRFTNGEKPRPRHWVTY